MNTSAATAGAKDDGLWTARRLLVRHRLAALGAAGVLAVMLAMFLLALLGARAGAVTDATTCSQWGLANQNQQTAYARLYIREHGSVPRAGTSPVAVIAAIDNGCLRAYTDDVADTATVAQAISGTY